MSVRGRAGLKAVVLLAGLTAVQAAPAHGQDYDMSAGWGAGYLQFAPFVEAGSASPAEIGLGGAPVALLQFETWHFNRWVGARLGGTYTHSTVNYPATSRGASTFGVEGAALLRVVPPAPERVVSMYLMGGGGVMWYALGEDPSAPRVPIAGTNVLYDQDERRQFTALAGGGLEYLSSWRVMDGHIGVRLEAADQITFGSPFRPIDGEDPGMKHNLRFSVVLFSGAPKLF